MPSPTKISEMVRKKKRAKTGRTRKKENRLKGTINYFKHFDTPAADDKTVKKAS